MKAIIVSLLIFCILLGLGTFVYAFHVLFQGLSIRCEPKMDPKVEENLKAITHNLAILGYYGEKAVYMAYTGRI